VRFSPCSTFKKALFKAWEDSQNPTTWMKNSCVWYSQVLTPQLGMKKFQDYVKKFNYGNQDLSGDRAQNNGITNAWLSSSLEITPEEQAVFLEKLLANTVPVSAHAQQMTRNILYVEDLPGGWKLYGKTGTGFLLSRDRTEKFKIKHGRFIGWIEKDDKKEDEPTGSRAKKQAQERLLQLIEQIENSPLKFVRTTK
jgi:beta-lactamase class D